MKIYQEDIKHLLIGAAFFSTGGGGSLIDGLEIVKDIRTLTLLNEEELKNDNVCATVFLAGSVNPPSLDILRRNHKIAINDSFDLVIKAFKYLERKIDKKIHYILPVELGGFNTAVSILLSFKLGLPLINADLTGRSAPEMFQTSYYLGDIPPSPAAVTTIFDEKHFVEDLKDYKRFDDFLRSLVINSYGYDVGVANFPLSVKRARDYFIKGTMAQCIEIGSILRSGHAYKAIEKANGKILFKGELVEEVYEEKAGFTNGYVLLENKDEKFRIEYKNEILVSLKQKKIIASIPDLIGVVTVDGVPVINTKFPKNTELIVYSILSNDLWLSPKGKKIFDLHHFGYKI